MATAKRELGEQLEAAESYSAASINAIKKELGMVNDERNTLEVRCQQLESNLAHYKVFTICIVWCILFGLECLLAMPFAMQVYAC